MLDRSMLFLLLLLVMSMPFLYSQKNRTNIVAKEYEQWRLAVDEMKSKNIKLKGFYHTSSWAPYWKDILTEQLYMLDGKRIPRKWSNNPSNTSDMEVDKLIQTKVSLLEESEQLFLNVAGPTSKDLKVIKTFVNSLNLKFKDHIYFNYNKTADRGEYGHLNGKKDKNENDIKKMTEMKANMQLSEGESSTIMALHEYCKNEISQGRSSYIYYIHSKGGCCVRGKKKVSYNVEPVASWREGMNTFNIEFPSICLRALNLGYSACGMEYQDAHYSGNFWWANCEHIAALPPLEDRFDAWKSELFILRPSRHHHHINTAFGENCAYSTYKCIGVNHYDHECPRSIYRNKILKYTSKFQLPTNDVAKISKDFNWVKKHCGDLRRIPYEKQDWYSSGQNFPLRMKESQH